MLNASQSHLARVKAMLTSRDPKVRDLVQRAGADILNLKLSPSQVHVDATLTNLSVQYKNEAYIGLDLLPVSQIPVIGGVYFKYGKRDRLATPDDAIGTRSTPNEVSETRTKATVDASTYALMDFIDQRTLNAADAPLNEMVDLVASVNDAIDFREEVRIAAIMTNSANFPGQTTALASAVRWDSAGGGDPVGNIMDWRSKIWQGMGQTKVVMYSPIGVYNILARHPAILDLFKYTEKGVATKQMIAGFFECDEYLVGKAWDDTANIGQSANYARIWGTDSFGIARVATSPSLRTVCAGFTLRHGPKITTQWYDPQPGIGGGYYAKVGLDEVSVLVAPDACYLGTTVLG